MYQLNWLQQSLMCYIHKYTVIFSTTETKWQDCK